MSLLVSGSGGVRVCGHVTVNVQENFPGGCGVDGAAAGIRTGFPHCCDCNFEAWEAPVIDQAIPPTLPGWELDHGLMEQSVLTHSESSHDDRNSGKHRVHNKNLPKQMDACEIKSRLPRQGHTFRLARFGTTP